MRLGGQQQTEISEIVCFFYCYVLFEKNFIVIYMLDNFHCNNTSMSYTKTFCGILHVLELRQRFASTYIKKIQKSLKYLRFVGETVKRSTM